MTAFLRILLICLGLSVVSACGGGTFTNGAGPLAEQPTIREYRLGSGDKVRVTVFGEASLSGEYQVSGTGAIALPLIGQVQAVGLTTAEFQDLVAQKLSAGYINEPRVSAEVLNYRPFYILGEVRSPGEYPYTNGLTVLNAVATAGGFTYRADSSRVFIKRGDETVETAVALTTTTPVSPGDTIRIGERYF